MDESVKMTEQEFMQKSHYLSYLLLHNFHHSQHKAKTTQILANSRQFHF